MITLEDNAVHFAFPEIKDQLDSLCTKHAEQLAYQFLAENRLDALQTLLETDWRYKSADEAYRKKAGNILTLLSKREVQNAILHYLGMANVLPDMKGRTPMLSVSFQRTLRIPDDGKTYPLPPGLGEFPLVEVDDYASTIPQSWLRRGGVMMPMYQAEALWLYFKRIYPCAVKVATGKINSVSGKPWQKGLQQNPQDYLITPEQPWLDGYNVGKGLIRQFVAMPLGKGYSVEEQISGSDEFGGIQLQVYPLKAEVYFTQNIQPKFPESLADILQFLLPIIRPQSPLPSPTPLACMPPAAPKLTPTMGLGAGGKMRQEIYKDRRLVADWDMDITSRCFVHLCNSEVWKKITGQNPPSEPFTAKDYAKYKLPWFDYYRDDLKALKGATAFHKLKTVSEISLVQNGAGLPDNDSVDVTHLVQYGKSRRQHGLIREWEEETNK
jgi:hypothetical protein